MIMSSAISSKLLADSETGQCDSADAVNQHSKADEKNGIE